MYKLNGGVKSGFWTEGAIAFYTVTLPAVIGDIIDANGVVVPNSVLDVVTKVVGEQAVIVGIEYAEGSAAVKLALTRSGWSAATLQAALVAVGAGVSTNVYPYIPATETYTNSTVTFVGTTVAVAANFTGSAV